MKLNIRGDKITVTQSMKGYIEEKLAKLDKYFENPDEINTSVLVRVRDLEQIIEVTAPTKKFTLRAEESNEDFYAAVDLVVEKLERQIVPGPELGHQQAGRADPIQPQRDHGAAAGRRRGAGPGRRHVRGHRPADGKRPERLICASKNLE